jgi:hypothetical protein
MTEVIIDYAHPCMVAENGLKRVHEHMLNGNYEAAIEAATMVLVDTKIMINSIKEMKERANANTKEL